MQVTATDAPGNLKIATIKQWSILNDEDLLIMCDASARPQGKGVN
jgi:hypothetical protein